MPAVLLPLWSPKSRSAMCTRSMMPSPCTSVPRGLRSGPRLRSFWSACQGDPSWWTLGVATVGSNSECLHCLGSWWSPILHAVAISLRLGGLQLLSLRGTTVLDAVAYSLCFDGLFFLMLSYIVSVGSNFVCCRCLSWCDWRQVDKGLCFGRLHSNY